MTKTDFLTYISLNVYFSKELKTQQRLIKDTHPFGKHSSVGMPFNVFYMQ